MKNESDSERYQQFLKSCQEGSSFEDDPVVRTVRERVRKVAPAWGWAGWIEDLEQETFITLCKGEYRGDGPLDGYISHVLGNEIKRLWRKEGRNRRVEMPAELEVGREVAADFDAELSDITLRLIARSPRHLWWFIEAIVEADGYLSERAATKKGKVTRYKVGELRKELRQIWESMESEQAKARTAGD